MPRGQCRLVRRLHVRATLIILTMATPSTATLAYCASTYYGSVVGEKLTRRLREAAFGRMLWQHAAWCDQPGHTAAALGYVLGADAAVVREKGLKVVRVRIS